eukprot:CAMPEP_0175821664 /NCGR_PEP_ID=MMETSP0107_2-20121207/9263_1 /TAXON_ID=195067 ORGANISM="Goniomonas pacifica, Strain CCMP1869" /NCGR_SAMPLE_ID=MMETSP0107_2 /ASSEMBLY_ACC=CAM_ASM_000203 /LENGTH=58 /DNA_ID=CAMNT_0017134073 /DNA_START=41 /DNA_END=213 /DNA_ORIENTATION=+
MTGWTRPERMQRAAPVLASQAGVSVASVVALVVVALARLVSQPPRSRPESAPMGGAPR